MKKLFLFITIIYPIILISQNPYYPTRKDSISIENYNKLTNSLSKIYTTINTSTNANRIANAFVNKANIFALLGENKDSVFTQIGRAYETDTLTTCHLIRYFNISGSYGFRENCMRMDSEKWLFWCNKCNTMIALKNTNKKETKSLNLVLAEKLEKIYENDQLYRGDSTYNNDNPNYSILSYKQRSLDSLNLVKIKDIIQEYGYPGDSLVGDKSMVAFFVIQHADLQTRETFLPYIKKAVQNKDLSKSALIMILDRIYFDKYDTQIWGTQQFWDSKQGKYISVAIDNSEEALKLKKEVDEM